MTPRFTRRFRVRHYELDVDRCVHPATFVQYMQEAAIEASAAVGFDPGWYRDRGTGWVIRRLAVRYHGGATYGDDVDVTTWVSEMRGVRSTREYDLRRAADGARLARARVHWVYVDLETGSPTRFPAEFGPAFAADGGAPDLGVGLRHGRPTEDAHAYRSRRRVQFHDLDPARHVNHAVYVQWAGQAFLDALRAAGHPRRIGPEAGWRPVTVSHDVEYLAPALDGDDVEIVSRITAARRVRQAWRHEVHHAGSGKLLARDECVVVFFSPEGRPVGPPAPVPADLLRGPS
jgi:YbgC/YbaW family acyl-CoA thioester hydrolase